MSICVVPPYVPSQRTMVAIDCVGHTIHFHNSLLGRAGAEQDEEKVREEVVALLQIVGEPSPEKWVWVSETVCSLPI